MSAQRVGVLHAIELGLDALARLPAADTLDGMSPQKAWDLLSQACENVRELEDAARDLSADIEFMVNDPRCAKHDRLRAALERFGGTP